ncbi:MAG: hypothetical protein QGI74_06335 [Phycisphaerales bacterium]|jgi:hypothetical protein|nr:hypothetical protein [Phycisphaerales bacterium]
MRPLRLRQVAPTCAEDTDSRLLQLDNLIIVVIHEFHGRWCRPQADTPLAVL